MCPKAKLSAVRNEGTSQSGSHEAVIISDLLVRNVPHLLPQPAPRLSGSIFNLSCWSLIPNTQTPSKSPSKMAHLHTRSGLQANLLENTGAEASRLVQPKPS